MYVNRNFFRSESAEFHLLFSKHCPQNNLNLGIKTKHAPTGVDATVGLVKGHIYGDVYKCQTYVYRCVHSILPNRFKSFLKNMFYRLSIS